jgi:hypothetical protein
MTFASPRDLAEMTSRDCIDKDFGTKSHFEVFSFAGFAVATLNRALNGVQSGRTHVQLIATHVAENSATDLQTIRNDNQICAVVHLRR